MEIADSLKIPRRCRYVLCKNTPTTKLRLCDGCLCASFCSRECLKKDWNSNGPHRYLCQKSKQRDSDPRIYREIADFDWFTHISSDRVDISNRKQRFRNQSKLKLLKQFQVEFWGIYLLWPWWWFSILFFHWLVAQDICCFDLTVCSLFYGHCYDLLLYSYWCPLESTLLCCQLVSSTDMFESVFFTKHEC